MTKKELKARQAAIKAAKKAEKQAAKQAAKTLKGIESRKSTRQSGKGQYHIPTTGIERKDVTYYKQHHDEFMKLVKVNNQRIKRLANKGMLDKSFAYQAIDQRFKKRSNGMLLSSFQGMDDEDIRKLIASHIKFATSKSITQSGIETIRSSKQENFINQLIRFSDISVEDRATLRQYLESLPPDKFENIIDGYSYILTRQFAYASDQRFLVISQDIVQKARMMHEADAQGIMNQVKTAIKRADLKKREDLKDINLDMMTQEDLDAMDEASRQVIQGALKTPREIAQSRLKRKATFDLNDIKAIMG